MTGELCFRRVNGWVLPGFVGSRRWWVGWNELSMRCGIPIRLDGMYNRRTVGEDLHFQRGYWIMSEEKLFQMDNLGDSPSFALVNEVSAYSIKIKEKHFEEWVAKNTQLLFTDKHAVMVIAQEVSGEQMADILALDSQGNLIIIEAKRDWSDRNTVGQILDYAAHLQEWGYDTFNARAKRYLGQDVELIDRFREFVYNPEFPVGQLCKNQRLFIVAPDCDSSLLRIVEWLKRYEVPIDYVPFSIMETKDGEYLLRIRQIEVEPIVVKGWKGDWFFNTNETYGKGAYKKMIEEAVIAVYGYEDGKEKLDRPAAGDRVLMYVNNVGVIGVGRISEEESFPANTVFRKQDDGEFHRRLVEFEWLENKDAIKASEISAMGYNLPVRSTLCKIYSPTVANRIAEEIARRAGK